MNAMVEIQLQREDIVDMKLDKFQFDMLGNRNLIKTQLQLPVDEFPFLNGGYATSSFAIISPNRKGPDYEYGRQNTIFEKN